MVVAFLLLLSLVLAIELFGLRSNKVPGFKTSLLKTLGYFIVALIYGAVIYKFHHNSREVFTEYLTGYLLEMVLSFDNVFVFILIFSAFATPIAYQNRVLFYGVFGAILMRGAFIFGGSALIDKFHFVILIFALILLMSGLKLFLDSFKPEEKPDLKNNQLVKILHKFFPVTDKYHSNKFQVKINGVRHLTPLFVVLAMIIIGDIVFAFDSIPAIFAVTNEPLVIYTSNMFAIVGLRSLFFVLEGVIERFYYLKKALSFILLFIGVKMCVNYFLHEFISVGLSLCVVLFTVFVAILFSIIREKRDRKSVV
jgi:tellurite resistance protein TerC